MMLQDERLNALPRSPDTPEQWFQAMTMQELQIGSERYGIGPDDPAGRPRLRGGQGDRLRFLPRAPCRCCPAFSSRRKRESESHRHGPGDHHGGDGSLHRANSGKGRGFRAPLSRSGAQGAARRDDPESPEIRSRSATATERAGRGSRRRMPPSSRACPTLKAGSEDRHRRRRARPVWWRGALTRPRPMRTRPQLSGVLVHGNERAVDVRRHRWAPARSRESQRGLSRIQQGRRSSCRTARCSR
mgnify:CR=1 FL=1